jgi:Ribonuclease G/E
MRIETKRCEHCQGLGRVPEDPALTVGDLRAETMERLSRPRPEFAERIARAQAEQKAAGS